MNKLEIPSHLAENLSSYTIYIQTEEDIDDFMFDTYDTYEAEAYASYDVVKAYLNPLTKQYVHIAEDQIVHVEKEQAERIKPLYKVGDYFTDTEFPWLDIYKVENIKDEGSLSYVCTKFSGLSSAELRTKEHVELFQKALQNCRPATTKEITAFKNAEADYNY